MHHHQGMVNTEFESQRNQLEGAIKINSFQRALHREPVTWFERRTVGEPGRIFNVTGSEHTPKNEATCSILREHTSHQQMPRSGEVARFGIGKQDKHPLEPMISRSNVFHSLRSHQAPRNEYRQLEIRHLAPSSPLRSNYDRHASFSTLPSMEKSQPLHWNKKPMGPVIFLDIDGVVHPIHVTRQEQLFHRDKMMLLRYLVQQSGASICLSSAWRLQPQTLQIVNQQLVRHGMDPVIDKTRDDGYAGKRSAEILSWVAAHEPQSWLAIDDLDLLTGEPRMQNHFLQTNSMVGLTAESCERGLRMLRNGKA